MNIPYLRSAIFAFHMPLFFLIAGYFVTGKDSIGTFIKKKAISLLIPYAVTGLFVVLGMAFRDCVDVNLIFDFSNFWNNLLYRFLSFLYGSAPTGSAIVPFGLSDTGPIWFLMALFFSSILVRLLINKKWAIAIILPLVVGSIISSHYIYWFPLSLHSAMCALGFVYIGALVRKYFPNLFDSMNRFKWIVFGLGIALLIVQTIFNVYLEMFKNYYGFYGLSYLSSILISFSFIVICKWISKINVFNRMFGFLGRNSLTILCVHAFEQKVIPLTLLAGKIFVGGVIIQITSPLLGFICFFIYFYWRCSSYRMPSGTPKNLSHGKGLLVQ